MIGLRGIPANSGGIEVAVENLSPLLVKAGAEVTVYCRNPYCEEKPREWKGVKLKYLPTINTKHTDFIVHTFLSTVDVMFKDYDIVHYHAMGSGLFSIFPRLTGKKTIVTIHGLDYEREKWGAIAKAYLKFSERLITIFPNNVITVSKKIKKYYMEKYNKEIEFIPNGVDIPETKSLSSLKKYGLKKDNYILSLGRIVPEKGVYFLIKAFREIKTDLKLVIVGDATHTDKYLNEVKESAEGDKRIIFTGSLHGEEKAEAYSNALFFVLPSTIEGMPVVLLEAMSFGTCSLTSDIEENVNIIGNEKYGFLFKSKNVNDMRKRLEYLINNKEELKEKKRLCRENVKKNFQWEKIAKKTFDVYKKMLIKNEKN